MTLEKEGQQEKKERKKEITDKTVRMCVFVFVCVSEGHYICVHQRYH